MGYGGDKTTIMVLKVDLQCCSCYKKVKKILCKFPQIRNQVYDEKNNTVIISVVCCDPEKLRDKLCCKGCGVIISIEIKEPEKSKTDEKPKTIETHKQPESSKQPEGPKVIQKVKVVIENPKGPEKSKEVEKVKVVIENPKGPEKSKEVETKPKETSQPVTPTPTSKLPISIQEYPQPPPGYCCGQCYEGHTGGPCNQWYGRPVPPPPCYNYYGPCPRPYGYCTRCRCDHYFSDENATGCSIM